MFSFHGSLNFATDLFEARMTLQRDTDEDVVVVMASTIPPGIYSGEPITTTTEPAFEETNANDYR